MKLAEIGLPYWKQGDDMRHYLEQCDGNVSEALELHAEAMEASATLLREVKEVIGGESVSLYADGHSIEIDADDAIIDRLIELDLADLKEPYEDDWDAEEHTCLQDPEPNSEWVKDGF